MCVVGMNVPKRGRYGGYWKCSPSVRWKEVETDDISVDYGNQEQNLNWSLRRTLDSLKLRRDPNP